MAKNLKKLGVVSVIVFVVVILGTLAYAANEPDISLNDNALEIRGCEEGTPSYANVSIVIYNPGYTSASIDPESADYVLQIKEAVFWMGQKNADRNGGYEFVVDMKNADPGEYTIVTYSQESDESTQIKYFYFTKEQQNRFIEDIVLNAKSWEDVKKKLLLTDEECTTAKVFSLSDPLYFSADADGIAKLLYARTAELNPEDISGFTRVLLECALADNLSNGNEFDIEQYFTLFSPDDDFVDTYKSRVNDTAKKSFTALFRGEELNTMEDISNAFEVNTFLAVVNNIKNWADINYMIETHGDSDSIDLSMDKYEKCKDKEELAVELAKKAPYTSIEDFDDTLVKQAKKIADASKGGSSSGGGGGGGGKIGLGTTTTLPQISADEFVETKEEPTSKFTDIDSVEWARESIEYLADKNIVSGTANGTFEPNREIKREEFIKMLVSAFAKVDSSAECTFTDVSSDSWFYAYAATAQKLGVLSGYADGRMGVGENITREDLAVLAYRMAIQSGIEVPHSNTKLFPDEESIADYAKIAVYGMKATGIINGMGDGTFAPKAYCTRAQAARIIHGLMKLEGDR